MTFSRLTLGDPRLKSKLRGGEVSNEPPCAPPVTTGSSLLADPGLENYFSLTGRTEFSYRGFGSDFPNRLWPSDDTLAEEFDPGETLTIPWISMGSTGFRPWVLSTANPRSGTYHARIEQPQNDFSTRQLGVARVWPCEALGSGNPGWRVSPGLVVRGSLWGWCSVAPAGDGFTEGRLFVGVSYYDINANHIETHNDIDAVTTSYQQFVTESVAPSGAYMCTFQVSCGRGTSNFPDSNIDVDDFEFSIQ